MREGCRSERELKRAGGREGWENKGELEKLVCNFS